MWLSLVRKAGVRLWAAKRPEALTTSPDPGVGCGDVADKHRVAAVLPFVTAHMGPGEEVRPPLPGATAASMVAGGFHEPALQLGPWRVAGPRRVHVDLALRDVGTRFVVEVEGVEVLAAGAAGVRKEYEVADDFLTAMCPDAAVEPLMAQMLAGGAFTLKRHSAVKAFRAMAKVYWRCDVARARAREADGAMGEVLLSAACVAASSCGATLKSSMPRMEASLPIVRRGSISMRPRLPITTMRPYLASSRYQLVSQLAFATKEKVYRLSPGTDHYTFLQTPEVMAALKDKPMIFVSDNRYERDPRHGEQLKIETLLTIAPQTLEGLSRYLGSGMVPGIGPARKKALLMHFGTARAVRAASLEDLQRAPGVSAAVAQAVHDFYHGSAEA